MMTCCVCGRVGTRAFTVLESRLVEWPNGTSFWTDEMIECTFKISCRRRTYRGTPVAVRAQNREPYL